VALKEAGIRDLLVSVQGLGDTYDSIVGVKGAALKQRSGLENIIEAGIPVRFNSVLSKPVFAAVGGYRQACGGSPGTGG